MILVGVRYNFRTGSSMGVENFYIEKSLAEPASPESNCFDVKSSVIFSGGGFVVNTRNKQLSFVFLNFAVFLNASGVVLVRNLSLFLDPFV